MILPCVHFNTAKSVLGQNKHRVPMLMHPRVVEGIKDKLRKEESLGIFATLPCYQQRSILLKYDRISGLLLAE